MDEHRHAADDATEARPVADAPTAPAQARGATSHDPSRHASAFDGLRPPPDDVLADCVHCGFCLPTCPTYALWGEEMDSPRGRIYLMGLAAAGEIALDDVFVTHMDRCLGCMACVTSCPSGVRYDQLIEATRPQVERHHARSPGDRAFRRLLFAVVTRPRVLRTAALLGWAYQRLGVRALLRRTGVLDRLPARLRALESLVPDIDRAELRTRLPRHVPPADGGEPVRRVGLVTGCVQSVLFARVNAATARVLAADGCEVVAPTAQGCCGALLQHAGDEVAALNHARRMIAAMEAAGVDTVAVNAAGCGSTLKEYGHLLRDDPQWAERAAAFSARVRDVTELLAELGPRAERHALPARAAYHDACHLSHAQGVRAQPRAVLGAVPALDVVELGEPEICCGSAGVYNLLQPEAADDLGARKAATVAAVAPDVVVTANPGCTLQLRRHLDRPVPVLHPVEVIDASIRGGSVVPRAPAARRMPRAGEPDVA